MNIVEELTLGELINELNKYDKNLKVKFKIDDDETYSELYNLEIIHYFDKAFEDEIVFEILEGKENER